MTRKYYKAGETSRDTEFFPSNKNGMPIWYFMKHHSNSFRGRAGLYLISVYMPSYRRFVKIGLSTNLQARFAYYQTAMFPIWNHARIHAIYVKRADRIEKSNWTEGKAVPTALKKAEGRVHDELLERGFDHCGPEWFNCSVNECVKIMSLFHFGTLEPPTRADGHLCEAYIFSETDMIRVEDDYVNISQLAEPKTTGRPTKLTAKMKESKAQELERSQNAQRKK